MAKYVGKIFKIPNSVLKIKGTDIHYVQVKWYNPFTKKFKCNIITSLEDKVKLNEENKIGLHNSIGYYDKRSNTFSFFDKKKYLKMRNGDITPIPINKLVGFPVWSGFSGSLYLNINDLKGNQKNKLGIKK